jgi:hypothetical protein
MLVLQGIADAEPSLDKLMDTLFLQAEAPGKCVSIKFGA